MHNCIKWSVSAVCGTLAAFFGQYGLFFALVGIAIILDIVTGIVKAKATGEGLDSGKATKGFWKKISLFVALVFGIFLDFATRIVFVKLGINIGLELAFALIVCAYIIINESISICENLYLANPDSFPPAVGKWLKVAKKEIESKGADENDGAVCKPDSARSGHGENGTDH